MTEKNACNFVIPNIPQQETTVTIPKAAKVLGVNYRQLLVAVDNGDVPYYRAAKGRRMVLLSEVLHCLLQSHKCNKE